LSSISSIRRALSHELSRQHTLYLNNQAIYRETRAYDAKANTTIIMRTKENMLDYRFMPEPDLPVFYVSENGIQEIKNKIPELPSAMIKRFKEVTANWVY
jgi:aspartyl-tRNA(Asn)/glutamyl-tRNA(Gln) amidotransferase subunit B